MRILPILSAFPFVFIFCFSFYLFTLPGQAIPKVGILELIYFDKWVHAAIFFTLTISALYPFKNVLKNSINTKHFIFISIAALAIGYGIGIEFIQKNYVENRSFDLYDIVADASGVVIGYLYGGRRWL